MCHDVVERQPLRSLKVISYSVSCRCEIIVFEAFFLRMNDLLEDPPGFIYPLNIHPYLILLPWRGESGLALVPSKLLVVSGCFLGSGGQAPWILFVSSYIGGVDLCSEDQSMVYLVQTRLFPGRRHTDGVWLSTTDKQDNMERLCYTEFAIVNGFIVQSVWLGEALSSMSIRST